MKLKQIIETIPNPQRIRIMREDSSVVFQGFKGVYRSKEEHNEYEVIKTGLFTYIAPKGRIEELMFSTEKMQPVPDSITYMEFSDLSIAIYLDIVIKA